MNAGSNRTVALTHALANAKTDKKPRFVILINGVYWIERSPPTLHWAGHVSDVTVVHHTGVQETLTEY